MKKMMLKFPVIFLLTLSWFMGSPISATAEVGLTQDVIDDWTDSFFYRANPQLAGRDIRTGETDYIREWNAIEQVVPDILVYRDNLCGIPSGDSDWILVSYDGPSMYISEQLDLVADAIFYARHPELGDRKIGDHETLLANEWLRIRTTVSLLHPCD